MAPLNLRAALAAGALLLLAQPATAWNSEQPACPSPFTPYTYQGCYADPVQAGLIFRSTVPSDDMTVEKCQAICKGNHFRYAALEYYGICYCGNVLKATLTDDKNCNTPCAGNTKQTCGGDDNFSVYRDPTFPDTIFSVSDYEDRGCYTDLVGGGRALGWLADLPSDAMTPKKCLAYCQADGLPYAGLEFGSECWCGTVLAQSSLPVSIGDCSKPCSGDSSLLCGAGNRLSLFHAKWESSKPCGSETDVPSSTTVIVSSTTAKPEPPKSSDKPEPPKSSDKPQPPKSSDKPQPPKSSDKPEPPKSSSDKPEPPKSSDKPEPPKTSDRPEPPKSSDKPQPPKSSDKPEPPKSSDKPEPPKSSDKPGPPKSTDKPEPPKSNDKPEPPKSTLWTTTRPPPVCTTVVPSHNYCCGRWCSQDLPDFDDHQGCKKARAFCHLQTAACFKYAGWPAAWECHKYKEWCKNINSYCGSDCSPKKGSCSRHHCVSRHPPKGGPPPVTKTVPCASGTATAPPTATTTPPVVPSPDSLCIQPSDDEYAYGPGNPVGGIDLPIVTCNDDRDDHDQGKHFKCYTERNFRQSPSFARKELYKACSLACVEQYDQCLEGYAEGGNDKPQKRKRSLGDKDKDKDRDDDKKRGGKDRDDDDDDRKDRKDRDDKGRKDDDDDDKKGHGKDRDGKDRDGKDRDDKDEDRKDRKEEKARKKRCKHQYADCLSENRRAEPQSFCLKYDQQ